MIALFRWVYALLGNRVGQGFVDIGRKIEGLPHRVVFNNFIYLAKGN